MGDWRAPNPEFHSMVMERVNSNHFNSYLGIEISKIEPGYVEAYLSLQQHHLQQMLFVHGGVSSSMADIVSGFAAYTLVEKGQGVVTVELKVSFLNPGKGDRLFATGSVIKAGQKLHFCEAEIWALDKEERIQIAKASATMAILNPEDIKR